MENNTALKVLDNARNELLVINYFKAVYKLFRNQFITCYKALNPVEKYKVYVFIEKRCKWLANEIVDFMTNEKTVSFKIS